MQIWKTMRASEKCSRTTFIEVDTSHRMRPLRLLYIMTLTYIFKVTNLKCEYLENFAFIKQIGQAANVPANLHRLTQPAPWSGSCSSSCTTLNLLSEHVISDVAPNCLYLLFESQTLESAIFRKIIHDYLANDDRYGTRYYYHFMGSYTWDFKWHTYISPYLIVKVEVKVMHNSTVNTLKIMTDMKNITIAIK